MILTVALKSAQRDVKNLQAEDMKSETTNQLIF